jgi:ABC-type amino acid transport substrate-binding protein
MKILIIYFVLIIIACSQTVSIVIPPNDNNLTSFEKKLVIEIFNFINKTNNKNYVLEFKKYEHFSDIFDLLLKNKNYIAIDKISISEERKKQYEFSLPYIITNSRVIMAKRKKTDLLLEEGYKAKYTYGCGRNTVFETELEDAHKLVGFKYRSYENDLDIYNALMKDEIDYFVSDYIDSWVYDLAVAFELKTTEEDRIAIMFAKDSDLKDPVNKVLKYLLRSSTFYKLVKSEFGDDALAFFKRK